MAAIYDVLVRYNPQSGGYEPQLAESFKPSKDARVWTLTLREGVTFSDGTPVNAEAVVWSINHYFQSSATYAEVLDEAVEKIATPSPLTVKFTLNEPWTVFWSLFTFGPGFILAPSSMNAGEFTPIGAGAFTVDHFAPGEELVLKAREDYWGGEPNLDTLRLIPLPGAQAKLDSLRGGGIDVGFLRNESVIVEALKHGRPGFLNIFNAGAVQLINNGIGGQDGRPGANLKVRRAVAYATSAQLLNQRITDGKGLYSKKLFQDWSTWTTDAGALPYDPEKARQILNEVMQETNYDGNISYTCQSTPRGKKQALAMQSLLEAVGFDVSIELVPNIGAKIKTVIVDADYDIACWGYTLPEAGPWITLANNVATDGGLNLVGYSNPEMDRLLAELKAAPNKDVKREIFNEIEKLWTETVPSVVTAATPEFVAWTDEVHGIVPTAKTIVLLDEVWIN